MTRLMSEEVQPEAGMLVLDLGVCLHGSILNLAGCLVRACLVRAWMSGLRLFRSSWNVRSAAVAAQPEFECPV